MPTFARLLLCLFAIVCGDVAWSQTSDRYADWPRETPAVPAPEEGLAAPVDEAAPAELAEEAPWQAPARPVRKLPFRFERAPAGDRSKVIRASATEAVPQPLSKPKTAKPIALKPRSASAASKHGHAGLPSANTLIGSVAVVVGLFVVVAWAARRGMPKQPPLLPREAMEVLGRQRFGGKQEVQLVRVGNKLVLIHMMPGHAEPLTEITDPEEVDRLTGICYQARPHSSSRGFQQTFQQFAEERPARRPARPEVDKLDLSMFDGVGRKAGKAG